MREATVKQEVKLQTNTKSKGNDSTRIKIHGKP